MNTPEDKLKDTKALLNNLQNCLSETEEQLYELTKKKEHLINEIKKTKDRICMLETVADQYDQLMKTFESELPMD